MGVEAVDMRDVAAGRKATWVWRRREVRMEANMVLLEECQREDKMKGVRGTHSL